jgi:hypothetical protein
LRVQRNICHAARVYERQSLGVIKRTVLKVLSIRLGDNS